MISDRTPACDPQTGRHRLSYGQERMWRFALREPESSLYHVPLAARLEGPLDPYALGSALSDIVARHDALRLRVRAGTAHIIEGSSGRRPLLDVEDLRGRPRAREQFAECFVQQEARRAFDLESAPPFRVRLIRLDPELHWLLLTFHHICVDAWSLAIVFRELGELYAANLIRASAGLAAPAMRYADFAVSQRERVETGVWHDQLCFWQGKLRGALRALPLSPTRSPGNRFRAGTHRFELPESLAEQVVALGRCARTTPHMTLLSVFQAWLSHRTGAEDILVGTPAACRSSVETETVVGLFVNTVVVRSDLSGNPPFRAVLDQVRRECLAAFVHQDMPFEHVIASLRPDADPDRNPGFEAWFVLRTERTPWTRPGLDLPGISVEFLEVDPITVRFDLKLDITASAGAYQARLEFNRDLVSDAEAASMAAELVAFTRAAMAEPHLRVAELGQRACARRCAERDERIG